MYTQDISRTMASISGKNGVAEPVFKRAVERASAMVETLRSAPLPVIQHCLEESDFAVIENTAKQLRSRFNTFVICGMGGSSLSGKMLSALAFNPVTNLSGGVRLLCLDNIDPHSVTLLLSSLDFASTCFLLISKSGGTAETLAHASIFWEEAQKQLGKSAHEHFTVIAEPRDGSLQRFAAQHSITTLEHSPLIGGRYAALTVVGLLPACLAGLDIRAIRRGAGHVIASMYANPASAAPVQGAALSYVLAEQGKNLSVLMPYCDRLATFGQWHRQIWAESLGKKGKGITPAPALGTVDQHSQLQLYLDGPRDKFFTLLLLEQHGKGPVISFPQDASLAYLHHHPIGDLFDAHQHATIETFVQRQCPTRVLSCPVLDEETIGSLTMHFILETILTGYLMDVDPFDQPAVEDGKKLAIQRLTGKK